MKGGEGLVPEDEEPGVRLFSHSVMNVDAVCFRLLGDSPPTDSHADSLRNGGADDREEGLVRLLR